mgnify:CR=1 FL=1
MIYKEITKGEFVDEMSQEKHGFSWEGAQELFNILISLETDTGEIKFDPIAIRCEWGELQLDEFIREYVPEEYQGEQNKDEIIEEYLNDCGYPWRFLTAGKDTAVLFNQDMI